MNEQPGRGPRSEERGPLEEMGERIGAAAGRTFGRGGDMATDLLGSMFGGALDSLGDWWSSPEADQAARSFGEGEDRKCRHHFEAAGHASSGREYETFRPLYQFGHMASQDPQFRGRDFHDVEPDLQRAWSDDTRDAHGEWPEISGYVDFGYSREEPTES